MTYFESIKHKKDTGIGRKCFVKPCIKGSNKQDGQWEAKLNMTGKPKGNAIYFGKPAQSVERKEVYWNKVML